MKRCWIIFLLVILVLAACSPQQGGECEQGVCVEVHASDTQGQDGSVVITVMVTSDIDRDGLGVSLDTSPGTIIDEPEISDGQAWEGNFAVGWEVNVKANQPFALTRTVHLPEKDGSFYFIASASIGAGIKVTNGIRVRLSQGTLVPNLDSQNFQNGSAGGEATWTIPVVPNMIILETSTPAPTFTIIWAPQIPRRRLRKRQPIRPLRKLALLRK